MLDYFPRHAWALVLGLAGLACATLLVPYEAVGEPLGVGFQPFFFAVSAVQLLAALGIGLVVVRYRTPPDEEDEWKYG